MLKWKYSHNTKYLSGNMAHYGLKCLEYLYFDSKNRLVEKENQMS